jgi:tRNA N6-adenosine threonylcarbamoyltransferase
MIVLGIETSCDETAAAIVDDDRRIRAESLLSQLETHQPFGGVVPEIAARAHLEFIDEQVARVMETADLDFDQLDGVAATGGPGLIGGVMVGMMTAKSISLVHGLPLVAVNHLEGHALTVRLTDGTAFPYLLLLVSGGHCQLLVVEGVGRYVRLGTTIDDSLGEAFDKTAKMLGLGYPGGPPVEKAAKDGDPKRFALPRPLSGRPGCHFSFSGLKTAIRRTILSLPEGPMQSRDISDICASFQAAAGDVIENRCTNAIRIVRDKYPAIDTLVVAGGVAANSYLRERLSGLAGREGLRLVAPPQSLCTDNATMIAWAGLERLREGQTDGFDFAPRPRWPLDPDAPPAKGAGIKA